MGVILGVLLFYAWTASSTNNPFSLRGQKNDYYNLLTDGLLDGHLHMKVKPLDTPDPANAEFGLGDLPYLLDASFHEGKYYLYFGPTPVLLTFLPYAWITGHDLSENMVTWLFASAGFLMSVVLVRFIRSRLFPATPGGIMIVVTLLLGTGNVCLIALRHPLFYEAAIACGYFLNTVYLFSLARVVVGTNRPAIWLVVAGLSAGLSVGSRPTYVFGTLLLPLVLLWLWRARVATSEWSRGRWARLAGAAIGPVVLCGLALMAYNYLRFGDVLEFGVKYQFTYRPTFDARFIPYNFANYYLRLPEFSLFFPFIYPILERGKPSTYVGFEHIHGQAWAAPFLVVVLIAAGWYAIAAWRGRLVDDENSSPAKPAARILAVEAVLFGLLGLSFLFPFLLLLTTGVRANRYMIDFQPTLIALASFAVFAGLRSVTGRARWTITLAFALMVAIGLLHNAFSSLQLYEYFKSSNPGTYERVARWLNGPTHVLGRWIYPHMGPIRATVYFPEGRVGTTDPLVVTGAAEFSNFLVVDYLDDNHVRFGIREFNRVPTYGAPVKVQPRQGYSLEVDLGSLYPPGAHPFFDPFSRGDRTLIRRTASVKLDGVPVLTARVAFYDASPGDVYVGINPLWPAASEPRFNGIITHIERQGINDLLSKLNLGTYGALKLDLVLPPFTGRRSEPLVVTGEPGLGDALFLVYEDGDHIRLGSDHWGAGSVVSEPFAVDFKKSHEVEISMGSLFPPLDDPRIQALSAFDREQTKRTLRVKWNGRDVFRRRSEFHEAHPRTVDLGSNSINLSSTSPLFTGSILRAERIPFVATSGGGANTGNVGSFRFKVDFPENPASRAEPLLVTGKTGAADLLFVEYLAPGQIRFGWDHWGTGVTYSEPILLPDPRPHDLEVSFGSFYPDEEIARLDARQQSRAERLKNVLRVALNGRRVFNIDRATFHPTSTKEIELGVNRVGASTASSVFTGTLTDVERVPLESRRRSPANFGPVELQLEFPSARPGEGDPLVTTGRTGAADVLYVTYPDANHVKFTWDHWGVGGPSSELIPVDYGQPHRLEIDMGSLYPAGVGTDILTEQERSRRVRRLSVTLNGRVVFAADGEFHPSTPEQVEIGSNSVGASGIAPIFRGLIDWIDRPGVKGEASR